MGEADALDELLQRKGEALDAVIELQVNDEVLVERIVNRAKEAIASGGTARADDNEESLKQRLLEYYKKTSPLIGYYHAKGQLARVDGLAEIDEVSREIRNVLDA